MAISQRNVAIKFLDQYPDGKQAIQKLEKKEPMTYLDLGMEPSDLRYLCFRGVLKRKRLNQTGVRAYSRGPEFVSFMKYVDKVMKQ